MPSILEEVCTSIFEPGPTPALMKAANATFAVTLPLLALLAVSGWNAHYAFLTVVCGCLWVAINWFAKEVRVVQAQAEAEAAAAAAAERGKDDMAEVDEQTGTESTAEPAAPAGDALIGVGCTPRTPGVRCVTDATAIPLAMSGAPWMPPAHASVAASSSTELGPGEDDIRVRDTPSSTRSAASTEDGWEKVSEGEKG